MFLVLSSLHALAVPLFVFAVVLSISKYRSRNSPPLPPGPPGEFLIGHLRIIPFEDSPTAYLNWGKQYKSDVLYFNSVGQPIIVLNSLQACTELLDKRGAKYADRPRFELLKLLGWDMTLTWLRWGPKMQQHRKLLQSSFTKSKVGQYQSIQLKETRRLLRGVLKNPLQWELELKRLAIAITANIAYAVDVSTVDHLWVKLLDDAGVATNNAGTPGASLVDRIPFVQHFPDWLPGLHSLKYAHDNRYAITNIHDIPYQGAIKQMEEGTNKGSFIHNLLERHSSNEKNGIHNELTLADIKGAAGAIIIAGSETTYETLVVFVLMMICNQDVQRKARAEIDTVIGTDRLPEFADIEKLQYLNYVRMEVQRIAPLSPLGIPHVNIADDTYKGMLIPKGSIIYQNVFAMHRDPNVYSNAYEFDPDRYIPKDQGGKGEPAPIGNFGFGRRICPGQFIANNTISIVMATMLSTLKIDWPIGPSGEPTPFTPVWLSIGQYCPAEFQATMTPRTKNAEELILNSAS